MDTGTSRGTGRRGRQGASIHSLALGVLVLSSLASAAAAQPGRDAAAEPLLEGAGSSLVPLSPTRVRRIFQEVRLLREPDEWRVEALELFAGGPVPETVQLGLPEFESSGDSLGRPTLTGLSFTLDGFEIASDSASAPPEDLGAPAGIRHFHSWRIPFRADEVRAVRVRYRLRPTRAEGGEEMLFFYLNPGTPWAGPSGRINVLAELGSAESQDLVGGWLRPDDYFVTPHTVQWRMDRDEPDQDVVLVLRPPVDWLASVPDRSLGLLGLAPQPRSERVASATTRELIFWRAHLWARRGQRPQEAAWRAVFDSEPWYEPTSKPVPVEAWSGEERALLAEIEDRLDVWSRHRLPTPEAAREQSRPPAEDLSGTP